MGIYQNEAHPHTHVPFLGHELWPIQAHGDLRMHTLSLDSFHSLTCISQRAKPATKREMTQFHSDEYVDFLSKITPVNMNSNVREQKKCE